MNNIILKNVTKCFDEFKAIDDLSLEIPTGKIFGIIGPNGAGKTTTLRMILNIILPDTGTIEVLGHSNIDKIKDKIGYLPEERGLYQKMKIIKLLEFLGELKGLKVKVANEKAKIWIEKVGLSEWKDHKLQDLSKGMQQKIQFIGTLLHDPEIIILDEPFSGLDPVNMDALKDMMLELKKLNKTIVFSTHVMDQAEKLCDEICLINKGKIVVNGQLSELKTKYGENKISMELENVDSFNFNDLDYVEAVSKFGNYYEVKIKDKNNSQELLRYLLEQDGVIVNRFQTAISSLHEIFVELVGGDNNE